MEGQRAKMQERFLPLFLGTTAPLIGEKGPPPHLRVLGGLLQRQNSEDILPRFLSPGYLDIDLVTAVKGLYRYN